MISAVWMARGRTLVSNAVAPASSPVRASRS